MIVRSCLIAALTMGLPGLASAQSIGGISLPGVINLGGGVVGGVTGAAGGAIGGIGGAVGGTVGSVGGAIGGGLGGAVSGIGGAVGGVTGGVGEAVGGLGGSVAGGLGGGGGGLGGGSTGGIGDGLGTPGGPDGPGGLGGSGAIALAAASVSDFAPIALPSSLVPTGRLGCTSASRRERRCDETAAGPAGLRPRPGTPTAVVQACRNTVVASSMRYGIARVDAASAGPMRVSRAGADAPIEFRMTYERRSGTEVRQATVHCRLDTAGRVVAAL